MDLCSDSLTSNRGDLVLGTYRLAYLFQPYLANRGGDRFACHISPAGDLLFYIADASGHGQYAAQFWDKHQNTFDRLWHVLTENLYAQNSMKNFASKFNEYLFEQDSLDHTSQMCLSVGILSSQGHICFSNFGYGTHVLVQNREGAWQPGQPMFALKFGWLLPKQWEKSFFQHTVTGVKRLILMSDAFLGDDYLDVNATIQLIADTNRTCVSLPCEKIIDYFCQNLPHGQDDTTLLVVERC